MHKIAFLICVVVVGNLALSPPSNLSSADKARLKQVFDSAQPFTDLATAHYAVLGYKLLGEQVPKAQEVCKYVQTQVDAKNVDSIFYAAGISKALGNCPLAGTTLQPTLNAALVDGSTSQQLYHTVTALKNLGLSVDSAKVSKILTSARKKDDSALSLGYAFHVASQLTGDVSAFVGWIEDTVVQADEVDGRMLQFEGGLSISSIIVSGIYRLADQSKKPPPGLDGEKCVKFANYFLSRKQVPVVRAAYHLLDVLQILSDNKFHIPVSITLVSNSATPVTQPVVSVRVTNLIGGPLGQLTVNVDSATRAGETTPVSIKKPLTLVKGTLDLYELSLAPFKLGRGNYALKVNASPTKPDPRWVGNTDAAVNIKLMTEVGIENVEIGVGDVDQSTVPHMTKVQHPNKLTSILEADFHQKLHVKFNLRDKQAGDAMTAHQAFILLTHKLSGREIAFVADVDSANAYKFDLDVQQQSKSFGSLSGKYEMALIVGDAIISNPFLWTVAEVELKFHDAGVEPRSEPTTDFASKPEIRHEFRHPEKRPPPVVSTAFTGLLLVPLLLLFILWMAIGANVSNFSFSLSTIGFHLGLAAIFGLFIVFWIKLTMFDTLKYLIVLGVITFLSGNSMLSKLAALRKG